MGKEEKFAYGPTFIVVLLMIFFIGYIVMVYPGERALQLNEGGGANDVVMEDMRFTPDYVEIGIGTRLVWRNRDVVSHTVNFMEFNSGVIKPGETYSHTFDERGTFVYGCEFHPGMSGTVVVK